MIVADFRCILANFTITSPMIFGIIKPCEQVLNYVLITLFNCLYTTMDIMLVIIHIRMAAVFGATVYIEDQG